MTPEQGALLAKARQSLDAAVLLAEKEYPDFAVSRAYYAMLYAAEALLEKDRASPNTQPRSLPSASSSRRRACSRRSFIAS